jgi:hypothetical protein
VREQLGEAGYPLLKGEMLNRVAYPEAGIEGLSPSITDPDGAAARDIVAMDMSAFAPIDRLDFGHRASRSGGLQDAEC